MQRVRYWENNWFKAVWQTGSILLTAAVVALAVNQIRPGRLPLLANWSPEAQLTLDSGDSLAIAPEEAEALFLSGSMVVLDARPPELFQEGHIRGALNVPVEDLGGKFESLSANIPLETILITYCDGETCNLSKDLAMALLEKGYRNVRVLVNGWTVWQERGLPIEREVTDQEHP